MINFFTWVGGIVVIASVLIILIAVYECFQYSSKSSALLKIREPENKGEGQ